MYEHADESQARCVSKWFVARGAREGGSDILQGRCHSLCCISRWPRSCRRGAVRHLQQSVGGGREAALTAVSTLVFAHIVVKSSRSEGNKLFPTNIRANGRANLGNRPRLCLHLQPQSHVPVVTGVVRIFFRTIPRMGKRC